MASYTLKYQLATLVVSALSSTNVGVLAKEEGFLRAGRLKEFSDPKLEQLKNGSNSIMECTPELVAAISEQMPYNRCPENEVPCVSHCIETVCPEASWLERYYSEVVPQLPLTPFVGLSVGCNKGLDAVDTLRMGSNNPRFTKEEWRDAMFGDDIMSRFNSGACNQGSGPTFPLTDSNTFQRQAVMHCIEPVPATVERLQSSAQSLGWDTSDQRLVISPFAISKQDDSGLYFPTNAEPGKETLSFAHCVNPLLRDHFGCKQVPVYSLDTYGSEFMIDELSNQDQNINVLSVDAEGYDFDILQGGHTMLSRAEYLEFEFHRYGQWKEQSLKDAVDMLDNIGFTCYWAGKGKLWRMTGQNCFLDHYETKCWSNVACANRKLVPKLLDIMEETFMTTIQDKTYELVLRPKVKPSV